MKNIKKLMRISAIAMTFSIIMISCRAFTDISKIPNYLSLANEVGRSAEGPVPLAVKVNLDENWGNLLNVINESGVNVNLDLSLCTMTNTEFDPGENGSENVVSLILPDAVKSIAGDFSGFANLVSIQFPASVDIGDVNPFVDCSSLTFKLKGKGDLLTIENDRALTRAGSELISYPSAKGSVTLNNITAVGRSAFNHTDSDYISLPDAITIGMRAFRGCEKLETVDLPAVTTIGDEAFYGDIALKTIYIPSVVTIGDNAAANTGNVSLTITFGQPLETIGTGMFNEIRASKSVTVKTTMSEFDNVTNLRNAIRGRGWKNGSFTLAAQTSRTTGSGWWTETVTVYNYNTNINLIIEGY